MKKLSLFILSLFMVIGFSLSLTGCGTETDTEIYSAEVEFRFSSGTHVTRANGDYVADVTNRESTIPGNPESVNLDFTEYNFSIGRSFIPVQGVNYQVDVVLMEQNRYQVIRLFSL